MQVLSDTTCLGSNPACQTSFTSSQFLIIWKKAKGSQGEDVCKSPFPLGRGGGFSWGGKSVFPDPSISYKIGSVFSGCSTPWGYKLSSASFQSESCFKLAFGATIDNHLLPLRLILLWCNKLEFYTVSRDHLQTTLNKCSPSISIAFQPELTR